MSTVLILRREASQSALIGPGLVPLPSPPPSVTTSDSAMAASLFWSIGSVKESSAYVACTLAASLQFRRSWTPKKKLQNFDRSYPSIQPYKSHATPAPSRFLGLCCSRSLGGATGEHRPARMMTSDSNPHCKAQFFTSYRIVGLIGTVTRGEGEQACRCCSSGYSAARIRKFKQPYSGIESWTCYLFYGTDRSQCPLVETSAVCFLFCFCVCVCLGPLRLIDK